jgi:quercetin dioxygenase-like cupin family protein
MLFSCSVEYRATLKSPLRTVSEVVFSEVGGRQRSRVWGMRRATQPGYASSVGYAKSKEEHTVATRGDEMKLFTAPGEGAHLPVLDIVHKVTADRSGGTLTVEEWGLPPGMMIPPHTHTREDECNFVLRGELTCDVGGEIVVAPAGSYVLKPRGVPHALCNTGTEPVWVVEILTPGGFEAYFDEYEQIASKLASGEISDEGHRRARAELGERYGVVWPDERISEARERFGI